MRVLQITDFQRIERLAEDANLVERAALELVHLEALAERQAVVAAVQAVPASGQRAAREPIAIDRRCARAGRPDTSSCRRRGSSHRRSR